MEDLDKIYAFLSSSWGEDAFGWEASAGSGGRPFVFFGSGICIFYKRTLTVAGGENPSENPFASTFCAGECDPFCDATERDPLRRDRVRG